MTRQRIRGASPLVAIVLLSGVFAVSCGLNDNREALARQYLQQRISTESAGTISLDSLKKTNGYDQTVLGTKMYVLEWTGELLLKREVWKAGNALVGYWTTFGVMTREPSPLERLGMAGFQFLDKSTRVRLAGVCQFRSTDNGWRVEECEVKGSQVIPKKPVAEDFVGTWGCQGQTWLKIAHDGGKLKIVEPSFSGGENVSYGTLDLAGVVKIPNSEDTVTLRDRKTIFYGSPDPRGGFQGVECIK
jgi:hypothetical protein